MRLEQLKEKILPQFEWYKRSGYINIKNVSSGTVAGYVDIKMFVINDYDQISPLFHFC
jgi:hypothetical protein